jgi:hypothetical protein
MAVPPLTAQHSLGARDCRLRAGCPRALVTAKKLVNPFYPVADNAATTMATSRSKFVDSALEAVKDIGFIHHHDREGLVVLVVTHFAS